MDFLNKYKDAGLLIIRIGVGLDFFFLHGWGKITGGPERWASIGQAMPAFGFEELFVFWGFMAAITETVGALLFAAGIFYRPAAALLTILMAVAVSAHIGWGDSWGATSDALRATIVFLGMFIAGPGKHTIDKLFKK